jgi:hypothetical protein
VVEAFFSIITARRCARGSFPTVADIIAAIQRFSDAWNDCCTPSTWSKNSDTIISKANYPGTARHERQQRRNTDVIAAKLNSRPRKTGDFRHAADDLPDRCGDRLAPPRAFFASMPA